MNKGKWLSKYSLAVDHLGNDQTPDEVQPIIPGSTFVEQRDLWQEDGIPWEQVGPFFLLY